MKNLKVLLGIGSLITLLLFGCQKELIEDPNISTDPIVNEGSKILQLRGDTLTVVLSNIEQQNALKSGTLTVDYLKTFKSTAGDQDYFILKSNTIWKIDTYPSWATISPMSGTGNANITVTVSANTGAQRAGTITLSGIGVSNPVSINMIQLAAVPGTETLSVDYLKTFTSKAGDNDYFILKSNTTWKVTSYPSWLTVSPLSGTGDSKVTVTTTENTGAQRTGAIILTGTGVSQSVSISALQLAGTAAPAPIVVTPPVQQANYYVSPTGSDSNPGTFDKPFATWQKAYSVMTAGQLTYIRGGKYYTNTNIIMTGRNGTAGSLIKLWAYPGETPVLSPATGFANDWGINLKADYIHLKGLEITGFKQDASQHLAPGIYSLGASNCIFEQLNLHHNAMGAYIKGNNNLYLNCDFHHNQDPYRGYGNGDGLEAYALTPNTTASTTTIKGCRAWANADDGFDVSDCDANVVIENCWSWKNGYQIDGTSIAGDGNGFKLGWTNGSYPTTVKRKLVNCKAWSNTGNGFDQNNADCAVQMYNNTSYDNGRNTGGTYGQYKYGFQFQYKNSYNVFKNNISYKSFYAATMILSNSTQENNSWNTGFAVSDADFITLNSTGLDGSRQTDGSLPATSFLKISSTSKLLYAGVNVGLTFTGSAPSLGAN